MVNNESILGKPRANLEAKKRGHDQIALVTEYVFETQVLPLLEQVGTDFLERGLPPIHLSLIEEARRYIEEREGVSLKQAQGVIYYILDRKHRDRFGFDHAFTLTETDITRSDITLCDIGEGEDEKKALVNYFENGTLFENLHFQVTTRLTGKPHGDSMRYHDDVINVGFYYDRHGRIKAHIGSHSFSADTNSEEQTSEFLEKMASLLDSREYLAPEHLAKTRWSY